MTKNAQLVALNAVGQSVWYDNVSREVLRTGELRSIIETGVTGLTSNPSIFKKAIADSAEYDAATAPLAKQGLSAEQICEELMVQDIAQAADLLLPVYNASNGTGTNHTSRYSSSRSRSRSRSGSDNRP